ncbi:unnamed protein product [Dibothriocephalus latus]|uniref:SCP domain-containing protein n=1 Tax=Dibothriocephalus latus TaxID=60516 RepID=A0A3P7MPD9_DIBLA|nr:unnamed protein product [Dibothriocephalus latus]
MKYFFFPRARAWHGCKPLVFDEDLAIGALRHAREIIRRKNMHHSPAKDYGENLFLKEGKPGIRVHGAEATQAWYAEVADYDFNQDVQLPCVRFLLCLEGHFSQCIWTDTKRAGFAVASTPDGTIKVVVAQYKPPGNYIGQWIEKVPAPLNGQKPHPKPSDLSELTTLTMEWGIV